METQIVQTVLDENYCTKCASYGTEETIWNETSAHYLCIKCGKVQEDVEKQIESALVSYAGY